MPLKDAERTSRRPVRSVREVRDRS
jgi:hypothetical protein